MAAQPGRVKAFGSGGQEQPRIEPVPADAFDRPLTVPMLVTGGLDNRALTALFWAAGGLFAVGSCVLLQGPGKSTRVGGLLFYAASAVLLVPALALLVYLLPRRLWLQVTVTGFVLTRRGEEESYG